MLKALCGFISSGIADRNIKGWEPPQDWLQILFGPTNITNGLGLFFLSSKNTQQERNNQFGIFPIKTNKHGIITGLVIIITAFPFLFMMEPLTEEIKNGLSDYEPVYRPRNIVMNFSNTTKIIDFGWNTDEIVYIDIIQKVKNSLLY
jgi:hypothetical protein